MRQNAAEFEFTYKQLTDEKSKAVMDAYINQRISGKFGYLEPYADTVQYFDKEIVNIRDIKCFVDCGAFIGDTYKLFLKQMTSAGIDFTGQAFLWEPDDNNLQILRDNVRADHRVTIIPKGTGKDKTLIRFDGSGQAGHVSENGNKRIEIDTIDNIVDLKVDMIKMDIEGAEADALLGAEHTIKRDKPILAICVYHKREDLITIPRIIRQICSEYKFYLRAYSKHSTEIVLYATAL